MPYIIMGTVSLLGLALLLFFTGRLLLHRLVMPKTNVDVKLPPSGARPWSRVRFPHHHGNAGNIHSATTSVSTPALPPPSDPLAASFPPVANSFVPASNPFVGGFEPVANNGMPGNPMFAGNGFAPQNSGFGPTTGSFGTPFNGFLPTGSSMLPPGSGTFPLSNDGFAPASSGFSALYGLGGSSHAPAPVASPLPPPAPPVPTRPQGPPQNTGWLEKLHKSTTLRGYSPAPEAEKGPDSNDGWLT